jgi:hypothetical protein
MASAPNPGERSALVQGNMVGLGALYLILRNVRARMMCITLVVDVMGVHPDDRAADAPGLGIPATRSPILKVLVMTARLNQNKLPYRFGEALVLIAVGHRACLCLHLVT